MKINLDYLLFEGFLKKYCTNFNAVLVKELQFCKGGQWRFDYAIFSRKHKIAVEIEGGVFTNGGHTRGAGFMKDIEKYNYATISGYRLLRISGSDARDLEKILLFIVNFLEKML